MKKLIMILVYLYSISSHAQVQLGDNFNYQGELQFNNALAIGSFDFTFRLYDALSSGSQIGTDVIMNNVSVINGVFSTNLDFGNNAFMGDKVWLGILVKQSSNPGAFTTLNPRKEITSTPYAIHAQFVGADAVTSLEIQNGSITSVDLAANSVGSNQIISGSIGSAEIGLNAVRSGELATDSVGSSELKSNSVGSVHILTNAVGSSEIASNAVGAAEISTNAVGSSEIAFGAVDTNEIKVNAVKLSSIDGGEISVFRMPYSCSVNFGLSTLSNCTTRICSGIIYYNCNSTCTNRLTPESCSSLHFGYILSSAIN